MLRFIFFPPFSFLVSQRRRVRVHKRACIESFDGRFRSESMIFCDDRIAFVECLGRGKFDTVSDVFGTEDFHAFVIYVKFWVNLKKSLREFSITVHGSEFCYLRRCRYRMDQVIIGNRIIRRFVYLRGLPTNFHRCA